MLKAQGAEFWRRQIEAQRGSGLSAADFCRRRGLNAWSLYQWRRRLESAGDAVRLIPVTILDDMAAGDAAGMHAGIEVRLASGVVLGLAKHFDGASLRRAVEALR